MSQNYKNARQYGEQDVIASERLQALDMLLETAQLFAERSGRQKERGYKNNPTTIAPVGPYMHGPGGLFSTPGMNPAMFSAMVQPLPGMLNAIPATANGVMSFPNPPEIAGYASPLLATVTGVTEGDDDWADQPENWCDDPPTGGDLKTCIQTFTYGKFAKQLKQIYIPRVGIYNNPGDYPGYELKNPQNPVDNPLQPGDTRFTGGTWINNEIRSRMVTAGVGFQRMLAPLVYSGTPANNNAGGGAAQFLGFNGIYTTGRRDVLSQVLCPAMDSYLVNFGASVDSTNLQGLYLYQVLEATHHHQNEMARRMGLGPVGWKLSMDTNLFRLLAQIIPIQQYVRVISTINDINGSSSGAHLNISGETANAQRQDMYEGRWLPLNGERVPVEMEDPTVIGTTYTASTNTSVGKIFLHPMTVMGNIPVTYWDSLTYDGPQMNAVRDFIGDNNHFWTTDGGRFLWTYDHKNWCVVPKWMAEMRIISHTPQLGAVISNISFVPEAYERAAYPANSSFYQNGGVTYRDPIEGYPAWSTSTETTIPYPISN